ncbi:hypothetical protein [Micromonospora sp. CPCC 206061]|uniref:hypothetical protein n=1 Tax=Micromonospora sp. CPCC 206061 TaxID=3122410 RepID=UPI002FF3CB61
MRRPRWVLLAVAVVAGMVATLLTPAAAQAAYYGSETDYAVATRAPEGADGVDYFCASHTYVVVCVMPYGDKIYVADLKKDDYAAVGEWMVETDPYPTIRYGSCVNKLGGGTWGLCDKNFPENKTAYVRAARYNSGKLVDRGLSRELTT